MECPGEAGSGREQVTPVLSLRCLLSFFQEQPRGQRGWSRVNAGGRGRRGGGGREEIAEVDTLREGTGVGPQFYSK